MKTEVGTMLVGKEAVKERWVEYLEEYRETDIDVVGRKNGVSVRSVE